MKTVSPLAGTLPQPATLIDIAKLVATYYTEQPDVAVPEQQVKFGTSGHRGSSLRRTFNEHHILAITQAVCEYRKLQQIVGPLFLGIDTHALSHPAYLTAIEVLAANQIELMLAKDDEFTPTPAISHAILRYNRGRTTGLADGLILTPSHNPPQDGGIKYNPPNGGPADTDITNWIQQSANEFLTNKLQGVKRLALEAGLRAETTHRHDFVSSYVEDLGNVIDFETIRSSEIAMAVDPLGGAGVRFWERIAEHYKLDLAVVNREVDRTFRFMTLDWDAKIRMDPSSTYAMQSVISLKDRFDVAFACDTDHDRHGIVTPSVGLLPPNHFLAVMIDYLLKNRSDWANSVGVGKTVVSSSMIDKVTEASHRKLYEVPVGFKWFVDGLVNGSLGFVGEESAGATFLRTDGTVWTTDKDGIIPGLLAAEITAKTGEDPGLYYKKLESEFGTTFYDRVDAAANAKQRKALGSLAPEQVRSTTLAGDAITESSNRAAGNGAMLGGLKVSTTNGWFAARPSGTEIINKIYAESYRSAHHLQEIIEEAKTLVTQVTE